MPGFAEGFGSSFSSSFQQGREQGRLRDVMKLEQQERMFNRDMQQQQLGLQKEQFQYNKTSGDRQLDNQEAAQQFEEEATRWQQRFQEKQHLIQQRESDVNVMRNLLGVALDSKVPKQARQFMLKEMAGEFGIDAKSEKFKDMSALITGLDPDALTDMRATLTAAFPEMAPGEATAFAKGVLSGQITMDQIMSLQAGPDLAKHPPEKVINPDTGKDEFVPREQSFGMEPARSSPLVTMQNESETAMAKGLAEVDVEEIKSISQKAQSGHAAKNFIRTFRAASNSGKFTTGSGAGIMRGLSGWAEYLGMDTKELGLQDSAMADVMEATGNQLVVGMAEQLGRTTNLSLDILLKAGPGIFKTPEGNALTMELLETVANRDIALDDLRKRDYKSNLYPEDKPSFWEARDRLLRDFEEQDKKLQERMDHAAVKGQGIDWSKIPGVEGVLSRTADGPSEANNYKGLREVSPDGTAHVWDGTKWVDE